MIDPDPPDSLVSVEAEAWWRYNNQTLRGDEKALVISTCRSVSRRNANTTYPVLIAWYQLGTLAE